MGYHTTATQVIQARPDLSGQVAVVTGGSSGIGVETVRALASAGIDCVLCCRNVEAGQRVAAELQPEAVGKVTVQCLDLCDLSSVRAAATQLAAQLPRLDMLVLNAGVMAPRAVDGKPQRTADGFELQFGTNHLSHFYLCKLLLPKMKASGSAGRVVVVSSSAYAFGRIDLEDPNYTSRTYRPWDGYNQSKLANRLFVHELARRLKEEGSAVKAFSVHPGIIKTSIGDHIGFRASCFYALAGPFLKSPSQGAATTVFGAVSKELDDKSGAHLQDCAVVRVAQRGRDDAVAAALWSKSEELVLAAMQRRCIE
ncbi:hypothetical protein D9Q98_006716 [Chlorella vulgaris]|uniref:Uncharacterized protein n=1 Tax=Chlorella vulgaris TaxID=3077 RepID=A0A9D4YVC6_CHLVU|nr:hypothetical protein D9Q98_006716 [Chlorella vulgaris]